MTTEENILTEINDLQEDTNKSVEKFQIIEGSDEHLDLILFFTQPLKSLTTRLEKLNDRLYRELSSCSDKELKKEILPKMHELNRSCLMCIGALHTSPIYRDIKSSVKELSKAQSVLREMLYDLTYIRLAEDNELDNLLKGINEL